MCIFIAKAWTPWEKHTIIWKPDLTDKTSLRCNGSSKMIYLKDLKENKRFMDIGPTMTKWPGGGRYGSFFQNLVKIDFE